MGGGVNMACFMLNLVPGRFYQVVKREEVADSTLQKRG